MANSDTACETCGRPAVATVALTISVAAATDKPDVVARGATLCEEHLQPFMSLLGSLPAKERILFRFGTSHHSLGTWA